MLRWLAALGLTASAAVAADLSPSEQAAVSQRDATAEEISRRSETCSLNPNVLGQKLIAEGIPVTVVELPALSFVVSVRMVFNGPEANTFDIQGFDDVPNGGIAGYDFCNVVSLDTFQPATKAGDVIRMMAIQLRQGLDIEADYPNTSQDILNRDLLIEVDAGTYALLDTSPPLVDAWFKEHGPAWGMQNADGPGIGFGRVLALRLGPVGLQ